MQHEALQKVESEQNEFIEQFILQKWLEIPGKNPSIIHSLPLIWTPGHTATALITALLLIHCTKSPEHEYNMVVTHVNQ